MILKMWKPWLRIIETFFVEKTGGGTTVDARLGQTCELSQNMQIGLSLQLDKMEQRGEIASTQMEYAT